MKTSTKKAEKALCYGLPLALAIGAIAPATAAPVCFEAEAAAEISAPMVAVSKSDKQDDDACLAAASGKAYLAVPEGAGKPPKVTTAKAVIPFEVPRDGEYRLWCRVWWLDECGNSISMNVDEAKPFTFGQDTTYKRWHWVKAPPRLKQLDLEKGTHTLTLHNREDGVRIDQILLTTSRRRIPIDVEPITFTSAPKAQH